MNPLFLGAATARFVVGSQQDATVVVKALVQAATPFSVTPLPGDCFEIWIKLEFTARLEQIVGPAGVTFWWGESIPSKHLSRALLPKAALDGWIAVTRFEKSLPDEGVAVHAWDGTTGFAFAAVRLGQVWKVLGAPTPTGIATCPTPQAWAHMGPTYHRMCDSVTAEWIRGYPEDGDHENGNYRRPCCITGLMFRGHKRRVASKEALTIQTESDE